MQIPSTPASSSSSAASRTSCSRSGSTSVAHHVDPPPNPLHLLARDDRLVVVVGRDVEAVGVGEAEVGLDPALDPQVVLLPGGDDRADLAARCARAGG